ncbi:hypothetical protein SAMN05443428_10825 [Caloramator quimbayensis]|uniref:Uncharacterized protein n=1 Tax=Caloramator quimbayensis TaxID=1147123 RepID=A0A1T4XEC2_9CLOT|nr:hypothetical protein [Caloramator quimbayensis]SKA87568.1 hypothetical protein SAMN05443428_10825 [Caloramator quimbayensis]
MNKVLIECDTLIDKYELNRDCIMKQLQSMKVNKGTEVFITAYNDDFRYTLIGEIKGNQVFLTNIIKAIAFKEMDNTDLCKFIKKRQDLWD